jgi:hypothetical protein
MSREPADSFVHAGCLVRIQFDDDPESPREWDNLGHMVCWHSRYNLGDKTTSDSFADNSEFMEWWKENGKGGVILPLYLYDHSGITMSCRAFSCPWDSGHVGYIYATAEEIRANWNVKRITRATREHATKCLQAEVATYDDYLTGQVFGYEVYELLECDEDDQTANECEGELLDSCWGFFGEEDCKEEAKSMAEHHAKKREELKQVPMYQI